MKAVVYEKPYHMQVKNVPDPKIEHPCDVIVKITSTAICGSDLHMYEGRTAAEPGIVFGHENLGIITEVGSAVSMLKKGDRVVMPFNVACGFCENCQRGYTGFCLTVNPGFAGGAYGYVAMGPYRGGQAEYLRVPYADFNCLKLPDGTEFEKDFVLLSDVFPTGYHGAAIANVSPGETVAVLGAGPVGLLAAYSSLIIGASKVYVIDKISDRVQLAEKIGTIPVDFSKGDPVEQVIDLNDGKLVDKSIDSVGYQAKSYKHTDKEKEEPAIVINDMIRITKATGKLGIPGLYVPDDPGGADESVKKGRLGIDFGKLFEKGLSLATGQCNVKQYNRHLRDLIIVGRAKPSFIVSHVLPLDKAPEAYEKFDKRIDGYTKVILKP
jgi:glutathione-independent formaldehyde dehydrogenase